MGISESEDPVTPEDTVRLYIDLPTRSVRDDATEALDALVAERDALAAEVERLRDKWEPDTDEPLPGPPSWEMLDKANGRWLAAEARVAALTEALAFYANPDTYFAIAFLPDRPCGDFADDFEELEGALGHPDGRPWVKPGKRARTALAAADRPEGTTPKEGNA